MKTINRLSLFLCFLLLPVSSYAGSKLDFESVVETALKHSYDIKRSTLDIDISRSLLKEERSAYFPSLSARFNSQYTKDLDNATSSQVTAVGDTVLVTNTFYQNSFSVNGLLNLYDFGAREKRVLSASKDVSLKRAVHAQSIRDTKIKTLEAYRDLSVYSNELVSKKELLLLYKELTLTKERLFKAGLISRVDVSDEAIKTVKIVDEIDQLHAKLSSSLKDLSFLTGEPYEAEGLELAPIKQEVPAEEDLKRFQVQNSLDYKIYELALERKRAELDSLVRASYLPQIGLYSSYILYGQDPGSYNDAMGDFRQRSVYVGLVANIPIFDGFKSNARVEKTRLEIEQLKVERDMKLSELTNRYEKLREDARYLEKSLGHQEEIMTKTEENRTMTKRLTDQQIAEYAELLNREIEGVVQKHEAIRAAILKSAAARELLILAEVL